MLMTPDWSAMPSVGGRTSHDAQLEGASDSRGFKASGRSSMVPRMLVPGAQVDDQIVGGDVLMRDKARAGAFGGGVEAELGKAAALIAGELTQRRGGQPQKRRQRHLRLQASQHADDRAQNPGGGAGLAGRRR